jgi:NADH-quinone oxidoreductase subunit F
MHDNASEPMTGVVDRLAAEIGRTPERLIPLLQAVQEACHHLPEAALRQVAQATGVPLAEVAGVASFYAQFRDRPAGRHRIKVCIGTACHVKGAEAVYEAFRRRLGIVGDADTDADHLFTVEKVACLGCCMLAPAVQVDDVVYGFVGPRTVPQVLRDFLAGQAVGSDVAGPADSAVAGEVALCRCSSCGAAGADALWRALHEEAARYRLAVRLRQVGCSGFSFEAPMVEVRLADGRHFRYGRIAPENARTLLLRHFRPAGLGGRLQAAATALLERLWDAQADEPLTRYAVDVRTGETADYLSPQLRLAMADAGELDPLDLDGYVAAGGFLALRRAVAERSPDAVVAMVTAAGLRGRGGAGFPTGRKWQAVRQAAGERKFVIANGDEGDPGAFMDRMILESFPFRVIEGMAIAAYAVGAEEGVFYVRAEYPLAVRRLEAALALCRERGILGPDALGPGRSLELTVSPGAGAFVCGEETALIAAVEGRRGMPRFRPPWPAESGLRGCPTLVNNVETLALVPWILRHGAAAFAAVGTPQSHGTKTFALAGKIRRGGLVEVPMGMSLRAIVAEIGGGVPAGRTLKAVQVGGPSGGCIPAALVDVPVDYEALTGLGAMMGSGGLVVLDDTDCMVEVARYFLAFTQRESCGKCPPCRIGTRRMLEILERLCAGQGCPGDLDDLSALAEAVRANSLCGLGRTAPNPVLSTLRHFRAEYEAHLNGCCPAHVCKALIRYEITDDCIGCTRCAQNCGDQAIAARPYRRHWIDPAKCTRCDTCRQVCPAGAVQVRSPA